MSDLIRRVLLLAVLLAAAGARPAAAHPLDIGYLRIEGRGETVTAVLDIEAGAASDLLDAGGRALAAAELSAQAARLADVTLRRAAIDTDRGPCRWTAVSAELRARTASLSVTADCPSGARTLRWPMPFVGDPRVSAVFQLFVKARLSGEDYVTTVDRGAPELSLSQGEHLGFAEFVWSGFQHIGAAPGEWHDDDGWKLPDGLDHILFLLALMLGGGTLLRLAAITTGFTLGHSITLALSGLGLIRPSPRVIEPLIALSIAWVAALAFFRQREEGGHRWKTATAFGLIHGFGFAGALQELDLSTPDLVKALFGYNVGIELGQISIVIVLAPGVVLLQRRPSLQRVMVRTLAALIFIAGMYWFIERLIG